MDLRRASSLALAAGIAAPGAALMGVAQATPAFAAPGDCVATVPLATTSSGPGDDGTISWGFDDCVAGQVSEACLQYSESSTGPYEVIEFSGTPRCITLSPETEGLDAGNNCAIGTFFYRTALTGPESFKRNSGPAQITGYKSDGQIQCVNGVD